MIYRFTLDMYVKSRMNCVEKFFFFILLGYIEPFQPTAFQYFYVKYSSVLYNGIYCVHISRIK